MRNGRRQAEFKIEQTVSARSQPRELVAAFGQLDRELEKATLNPYFGPRRAGR